MSKYTTGEIAKLAGVTVRTVQFYDTKNILTPSELTEGGRRLYNDDDLVKLKTIVLLKDLGISLKDIAGILSDESSKEVMNLILTEQEKLIKRDMDEMRERLDVIMMLKKELERINDFSPEQLSDIADNMHSKNKLRKIRRNILMWALPFEFVEIGLAIYWFKTATWWPFALWFVIQILAASFIMGYYHKNVSFICPKCNHVFLSDFREMFWAGHTMTTRKLTCPHCGVKSYCVETYVEDKNEKENK